jgi:hypothetical protein
MVNKYRNNNMSEKWIYWKIPGIKDENYYYIKMLVDGANGLEIFMEDASLDEENLVGTVKINFGFVESYRFCDEHCRLDLWNELSQKHEKSFFAKKNFFEIKNSKYIDWLNKASSGIAEEMDLKHYVIMDNNSILDIVFTGDPEFEFIKEENSEE